MTIKDQLLQDLQQAMKAQDLPRRSTLRLLRAEIANEEIEVGHVLSIDDELDVIRREAKRRRDAVDEYLALNRPELVDQAKTELIIIETYLPKLADRSEVEKMAQNTIAELGGPDKAQMGSVMRQMFEKLKGRADGKMISDVVREILSSQ